MPITTPSWAEQGTASASSRVTSRRSRRLSRTRVVMVAMVTQPSPSTMGRTALPFKPEALNRRLLKRCQARQVARIFQHAKGQEEGGHDRQDQGKGIGHAHRPQAVLADQQIGQPRERGAPARLTWRDPWIDDFAEQVFFHQADQRAGAEHAHEPIQRIQGQRQEEQTPQRVGGEVARGAPRVSFASGLPCWAAAAVCSTRPARGLLDRRAGASPNAAASAARSAPGLAARRAWLFSSARLATTASALNHSSPSARGQMGAAGSRGSMRARLSSTAAG